MIITEIATATYGTFYQTLGNEVITMVEAFRWNGMFCQVRVVTEDQLDIAHLTITVGNTVRTEGFQ